MSEHDVLLAAGRRIIEDAARDRELGLHESACVSAHRGAVLVSEAWLRSSGQTAVSNSVHENVSLSPAAGAGVRDAALRLDRHRMEEGYPHRSFQGPTDPDAESGPAVEDARAVLAFVEREIAAVMRPPPARKSTEVFAPLADQYFRYRPGYPGALFETIWNELVTTQPRVVDVAAGAGNVTLSLIEHGARVVAVEPALTMLARARERTGGRWVVGVAGRGEALPLKSRTMEVVTVGQAFHWLEAQPSLDEFARVLVPGGRLAVFWNVVVPDDFGRDVHELVKRWNEAADPPVTQRMRATPAALAAHPAFDVDPPREYYHGRMMEPDQYVGYASSWSYCGGALPAEKRAPFERDLREVIARHHGDGPWEEKFITVLHMAARA